MPIINEKDLFKINTVLLSDEYDSLRNNYIQMVMKSKNY